MKEKIKPKNLNCITYLLISIFILWVIPINFTDAITQNQIESLVQIICPDKYGNWYSGSGTIIDSRGIILTNRHVVSDEYGDIIGTCFIGIISSIDQPPSFGSEDSFNLAEVQYYTTLKHIDAAILYLENPTSRNYSYINIWDSNSNSLNLGDKIEVVGFPNIGGATITYTSGVFSGFGSEINGTQNYLKTTAILEHGNSGGAAFSGIGQFIGIPTMAVRGTINSLGYILSVNSIKSWLQGFLGSDYEQDVTEQEPIIHEPQKEIQQDITTPTFDEITTYEYFSLVGYDEDIGEDVNIYDPETETFNPNAISFGYNKYVKDSYDRIKLATYNFTLWVMDRESKIVNIYYSFSKNLSELNEGNEKKYALTYNKYERSSNNWENLSLTPYIDLLDGAGTYYIGLRFQDENKNISERLILEYIYEPITPIIDEDKPQKEEQEENGGNGIKEEVEIDKRTEKEQETQEDKGEQESQEGKERQDAKQILNEFDKDSAKKEDLYFKLTIAFVILASIFLVLIVFKEWLLFRKKR